MKRRFQADNDLDYRIVRATRQLDQSIDFQSALEAGLRGQKDTFVLEMAAADNRILVSHDRKTMPRHFARFIERRPSPGLILLSANLAVSESAQWLYLVWSASEAEEYKNLIIPIP